MPPTRPNRNKRCLWLLGIWWCPWRGTPILGNLHLLVSPWGGFFEHCEWKMTALRVRKKVVLPADMVKHVIPGKQTKGNLVISNGQEYRLIANFEVSIKHSEANKQNKIIITIYCIYNLQRTYMCIYIYMHKCIYLYPKYIYIYVHIHIHIHRHIHIHIHTHTYVYIYIYIYAQMYLYIH